MAAVAHRLRRGLGVALALLPLLVAVGGKESATPDEVREMPDMASGTPFVLTGS